MKILNLLTPVALLLAGGAAPVLPQQPVTLTLGDAARFAAAHSAAPAAARSRADMEDARLRQQHADLLPTFGGTVSQGARTFTTASFGLPLLGSGDDVVGPVRTWDVRAGFRESLIDFASFARVRAGRAAVAAADAEVTIASQQAAAVAADAYVRALWAESQLAGRLADSTLAQDLLGIAQSQRQAGMATALDVTRARAQLTGATAQLIAARAARERASFELRRALGLALDAPVTLADSLLGMPTHSSFPAQAEAERQAIQSRADLRAVEAQQDAALWTGALGTDDYRMRVLEARGAGPIGRETRVWLEWLARFAALALALAERGVPATEYSPLEIKRAVAGNGRAEKEQVQELVRLILGLPEVEAAHLAEALQLVADHR